MDVKKVAMEGIDAVETKQVVKELPKGTRIEVKHYCVVDGRRVMRPPEVSFVPHTPLYERATLVSKEQLEAEAKEHGVAVVRCLAKGDAELVRIAREALEKSEGPVEIVIPRVDLMFSTDDVVDMLVDAIKSEVQGRARKAHVTIEALQNWPRLFDHGVLRALYRRVRRFVQAVPSEFMEMRSFTGMDCFIVASESFQVAAQLYEYNEETNTRDWIYAQYHLPKYGDGHVVLPEARYNDEKWRKYLALHEEAFAHMKPKEMSASAYLDSIIPQLRGMESVLGAHADDADVLVYIVHDTKHPDYEKNLAVINANYSRIEHVTNYVHLRAP